MSAFVAILWGNDTLTLECGRTMLARGHRIAAVVTRSDAVRAWAADAGLAVRAPETPPADVPCDWLFSIANLDLIPEAMLAVPRQGAVNFHDGPLPRHAGLNAPVWALIEGERRHGITWHLIEGGVDEGDILVERAVDIAPDDTALTLNLRCFEAALGSFDALLAALGTGAAERVPQDLSRRRVHRRADRPDGQGVLDVTRPADELERLVRALDHGAYWNPLCLPKLRIDGRVLVVASAEITEGDGSPGAVLRTGDSAAVVACGTGALALRLEEMDGRAVDPATLTGPAEAPDGNEPDVARHEPFWRDRLAEMVPATVPGARPGDGEPITLTLDPRVDAACLAALAVHLASDAACDVAWRASGVARLSQDGLVAGWVPLRVAPAPLGTIAGTLADARVALARRGAIAADLFRRAPELRGASTPAIGLSEDGPVPGCAVTMELGDVTRLHADPARISPEHARLLARRLEALAAEDPTTPFAELPRLSEAEAEAIRGWNATETRVTPATMHTLFEAQVDRTPEATALIFEDRRLDYATLDARANAAAHILRGMGVGPGTVVGLACARSFDLVVGAYAILKAGGAYLPLDPAYPEDRLRHYLSDSGARMVVTQSALADGLPGRGLATLCLDTDPRLARAPTTRPVPRAVPGDLAYLIYTSGSTGVPKGVMVEHAQVANFYAGMDAVVPEPDGTWLAVTSLSFDISVLELFYTTARGATVVIASDADRSTVSRGPVRRRGMDMSLYYWGNDDGIGPDKYRTLIEGARFADKAGFCAVWTPERHFHAFGGPYPNPSVTGAAVAAVTDRIGVRAGSCVAPLHHPARIAEEWAVIDNLTDGRAGLAIASGWQPDDFVLRPENTPPANKPAMIETIDTLRRLWRGEAVAFPRADGSLHEVVTQPRPVSRELPVWVTTAGNPETWREAGRLGANVLTHLLGQSVAEVGEKIALYHAALREAGHDPARFSVTLMLHTYLADSREAAREIAREPMKDYLRSAAGLIKQYAWAFPAFKRPQGVDAAHQLDLGTLSADELEGILDFAFERYFTDSGLFGTEDDAVARAEALSAIGVTEIACLIDYGIAPDAVLDGLRPLARALDRMAAQPGPAKDDFSIAAQLVRHRVTHLQCTPSMARMIAMSDDARDALSGLRHLFLGGEALPGPLVEEFAALTGASVTNMYGPTETTIWSATSAARPGAGVVDLGYPVANTALHVLDDDRVPVPVGAEGELWIGGAGVTRGYWNRPDLTAERFALDLSGRGRMYRTGDLVRRRADGRLDFLGRADGQVKLRGHRIETGEIEAALEADPHVRQAAVVAREDRPGDLRLVAYVAGPGIDAGALKARLGARLPAIMVPSRFVVLDALPLTPNRKVDRGALPAPDKAAPTERAEAYKDQRLPEGRGARAIGIAAPKARAIAPAPSRRGAAATVAHAAGNHADRDGAQPRIATIWARILGVPTPSGGDSFFDMGGHSLLAVEAHRAIRDELSVPALSITDIFRFPMLADLARRVDALADTVPGPAVAAVDPARPQTAGAGTRADIMARRRVMRARRRA
ncbi:natural product biosynthesis luciferase-like monooxygenase domain-containing protein [Roseivivax marinus]|uniref:MupA/Atu3671 family FMN-dependent luciferase-like monooxygenase n=1 Tax=Roseivivax marinus TaxID=1379903 RepID=UPI0008ACD9E9|nr:MupA/Atu3671 family FMN-dependent luciferase-like monooxygenase [Roseivivax marinus]SEK20486.1 natural product biosynthesis luciferase-like monooxygenase domain-containing protein [Roseivivax marinus]